MSTPSAVLEARRRGISDFARGVTRSDCPYSDQEKARAWEFGWESALVKKHNEKRQKLERFQ